MYPLEGTITMTGHLSVTTTPVMDAYSPLAAVGEWWARPSDPQTVSQLPTLWAPGGWPTRRSPSSCMPTWSALLSPRRAHLRPGCEHCMTPLIMRPAN